MKSTERNNRLTFFILNRAQKELIDNALKKQNQQMRAENVNVIKLVSVRAMNIKKVKNMNKELK